VKDIHQQRGSHDVADLAFGHAGLQAVDHFLFHHVSLLDIDLVHDRGPIQGVGYGIGRFIEG